MNRKKGFCQKLRFFNNCLFTVLYITLEEHLPGITGLLEYGKGYMRLLHGYEHLKK